MNKKRIKIILNIILVCTLILILFSPKVQAKSPNELWGAGKIFITNGSTNSQVDPNQMQNALMPIGRILVAVGAIVLTIVTIFMAIKYMMCDNAEKRAKLKTQLIGLVVSTVVIYGAQIIWAILYNFMTEVTN